MRMSSDYQLKYYNSIEAKEISWLWYPYIPYGKITIIQGDPGEGKTTLVLNLAALLTRGEKLPESEITAEPINVLYQSAEDGLADTIKPRLMAANADASRVMVIDETNIELSMTDHHLEAAISQTGGTATNFSFLSVCFRRISRGQLTVALPAAKTVV